MTKSIIIGAGLGGLSCAVLLAAHGHDVSVYEKNSAAGGKLRSYKLGTHTFDFGPNTITMPWVFNHVLELAGLTPSDYFQFKRLSKHTRHHFSNGSLLDSEDSVEESAHAISRFAGHKDAEQFKKYMQRTAALYHTASSTFFPRTFRSPADYLSPGLFRALLKVKPLQTMHHFHAAAFDDPRLQQMFDRYATYIGSSPYQAPATFSLISYLEWADGVYYTTGGNTAIASGLEKAAKDLGVRFYKNTEVTEILVEQQQAAGIRTKDGITAADHIVLNGDLLTQFPSLVDESVRPRFSNRKAERTEASISAFVIMAGLDTRLPLLKHHQVFFSSDYKKEFHELFTLNRYAGEPTIYISNSSYTDPSVSPEGDNLFILVNAPSLPGGEMTVSEQAAYRDTIYDLLEEKGLFIRPHLVHEKIVTPADMADEYYAFRGSIYGAASNKRRDAFLRPYNEPADISHLSFTGGSTHPGGGSPMVVLSGRETARTILKKDGILLDYS